MNEYDKIKSIIENTLGFHDYYKVVVTEKDIDKIVNNLISNNIRDIESTGVVAVEGEVSIVTPDIVSDVKYALDGNVDKLKKDYNTAMSILNDILPKYYTDQDVPFEVWKNLLFSMYKNH